MGVLALFFTLGGAFHSHSLCHSHFHPHPHPHPYSHSSLSLSHALSLTHSRSLSLSHAFSLFLSHTPTHSHAAGHRFLMFGGASDWLILNAYGKATCRVSVEERVGVCERECVRVTVRVGTRVGVPEPSQCERGRAREQGHATNPHSAQVPDVRRGVRRADPERVRQTRHPRAGRPRGDLRLHPLRVPPPPLTQPWQAG